MQNTTVGGWDGHWGKKVKNEELGGKIKKGKEKERKITRFGSGSHMGLCPRLPWNSLTTLVLQQA